MLPRFDYSLFKPTPEWDGCCWLDRDGTIVPVKGYLNHHTLVDRLLLGEEYGSSHLVYEAGYIHVGGTIEAAMRPSRAQKDALLWLAQRHERIMDALREQGWRVHHMQWTSTESWAV